MSGWHSDLEKSGPQERHSDVEMNYRVTEQNVSMNIVEILYGSNTILITRYFLGLVFIVNNLS